LIQPNHEKVIPQFLTSYLLYPSVAYTLQNMGKGQALKHLQITELAKLLIPSPPLTLQRTFAQRMSEVQELEATQAASHRRLDDLFESLRHSAFNGEL
jgi:type I restriction enzyme, S subunit